MFHIDSTISFLKKDYVVFVNFMDNALDQHPGVTIVTGGDVNQLDVNELCLLTGWNALVDFPTRSDAFLDNVFTNRQDLFETCYPFIISTKTDHTAVVSPVGKKLKPIRQKVRIRDSRKYRKDALYLALVKENWSSVCDSMDVNEAVNNFETIIHENMDICMPLKTVTVSSRILDDAVGKIFDQEENKNRLNSDGSLAGN